MSRPTTRPIPLIEAHGAAYEIVRDAAGVMAIVLELERSIIIASTEDVEEWAKYGFMGRPCGVTVSLYSGLSVFRKRVRRAVEAVQTAPRPL